MDDEELDDHRRALRMQAREIRVISHRLERMAERAPASINFAKGPVQIEIRKSLGAMRDWLTILEQRFGKGT